MYKLDTDNKDHNSIIFWFKTWENKVQNKDFESAKNLFGETFVKHFANTRIWEFKEFQKNKNFFDSDEISLWELDRYFEII